jgi:hypothetical protein
MRLVYAEHLQRHVAIGACHIPSAESLINVPALAKYRLKSGEGSSNPGSVAYNGPAMDVIEDVEGNDSAGCCVEAEEAHFIAVVTGMTGKLFKYTRGMVLGLYGTLTGYNPSNPATDRGTDPIACLNYFTRNAYADGSKLAGFVLVDATNKEEVKFALATFGNLKIWLSLATSYINPFPSKHGFVWDVATPNPQDGHCIGACGYIDDANDVPEDVKVIGVTDLGLQVMTWGLIGTMTWAAVAQMLVPSAGGGMASRVTPDWINAQGDSPTGLTLPELVADLKALQGTPISIWQEIWNDVTSFWKSVRKS